MKWSERAIINLNTVRKQNPLVHNITNFVVMNSTANVLLAIGASPIMAHAFEEVEEVAKFAKALVLNMGTLDSTWIKSMILAGRAANKEGIPVIFDPVGAGATSFRNRAAREILQNVHCDIIRGNAAEIMQIGGFAARIQGVDSLQDAEELKSRSTEIASRIGSVLAITGAVDLVCNENQIFRITGGDPMFRKVTGTGCAATALCAAFRAVESSSLKAAVNALNCYKIAGGLAGEKAKGPGSFWIELCDALAMIKDDQIGERTDVQPELIDD